jgi:hypothetical protein
MEMPQMNKTHIFFDALLEYVFEILLSIRVSWVRYERYHVDRGALLKLLSILVIVSKKTRENTAYTVQLAALRLASHDMQLMKNNLSPVEAMSFPLNEFDINMDVFSKDWNLNFPIPQHLCRSSLHELSIRELQHLLNLIYEGWHEEIVEHRGVGESQSLRTWLHQHTEVKVNDPTPRFFGNLRLLVNICMHIINLEFH